ncbi:hypothetical protein ACHAW5_005695 [Stephanodiscus triporus]|uniref:Uncharacterized protein n=1 Tax=Stephanodiscus triporus TaxID=2934178 RepID=A0ABD3MXU1_9STRA
MSFVQELLKPGGGIALIPYIRATITVLLLMVIVIMLRYEFVGVESAHGALDRVGFVFAGHLTIAMCLVVIESVKLVRGYHRVDRVSIRRHDQRRGDFLLTRRRILHLRQKDPFL